MLPSKKYEIKYLETFILQFSGILYYIVHNLENKIAADNLYNEVIELIEKRSENPESYEVFKVIKNTKYYKINVKNYIIFYVVKNHIMEIRRIYYNKRNLDNLL